MRLTQAEKQVAVIGAGPFGLAIAAALRKAGADVVLFGRVMEFWKDHVPEGMTLLSGPGGLSFSHDQFAMAGYEKSRGNSLSLPISAENFVAYGCWYQQSACPPAEERQVTHLDRLNQGFAIRLESGDEIAAKRVVIAVGMKPFAFRPPEFDALPPALISHTSSLSDLSSFQGKQVVVIGSGQSALESAVLLAEQKARVEVIARTRQLLWRPTGHLEWSSRTPPTGLSGLRDLPRATLRRWLDDPGVFRRLPASLRVKLTQRTLRTAASGQLKSRIDSLKLTLARKVRTARENDGRVELELDDQSQRVVDYVVLGTGFRIEVDRIPFLGTDLKRQIRQSHGYPKLNSWMESSVPGLYFAGAAAAWNFGPIMWFVRSAPWSAERIRRAIAD